MFTTVLPGNAQKTLAVLGKSGVLGQAYLAGGSALALQYGHRESIDFDFFTPATFDPIALAAKLSTLGTFRQQFAKGISLIGELDGVKMSYFRYEYPLLEPTVPFESIALASAQDIAAMKLVAICDRSTKKDFIDLYTLAHRGILIDAMLEFYEKKYRVFEANRFTLMKSLTYFEDAETETMPRMFIPLSWEEVKKFFVSESLRLAKKYLEPEKE